MTWNEYLVFAIPAIICWIAAGLLALKNSNTKVVDILSVFGILIFGAFIVGLWFGQDRPPLRTMGETRLWYSFFLSLIGYITYKHWKYNWLLLFSGVVATVFACVNIFKPEIHSVNLMPALQSYWFVPHVTVYILSYSMLGAATIGAVMQLVKVKQNRVDDKLYDFMGNITNRYSHYQEANPNFLLSGDLLLEYNKSIRKIAYEAFFVSMKWYYGYMISKF